MSSRSVTRARRFGFALMGLAFPLAACHNTRPRTETTSVRVDTLWYATARVRNSDRLTYKLADSIEYGFYRMASRAGVDVMRADLDIRVIDSLRVTAGQFLTAIAKPSRDSSDVVVLSVHGYATNHNKALRDATESYVRSGTKARWVAFSWPSRGNGVNWPRPGLFVTGAYRSDSVAALKSRPAFSRLVHTLHANVGGERMAIVTHSMGAQIVGETLATDSTLRARLAGSPLRAVGFFAPDAPAKRFVEFVLPALRLTTRRMVLYAANNDGMLSFSKLVNHSNRAGLIRGAPLAAEGLESVDVTNGLSSENFLSRNFGTHHGMRRESGALRDFFDIVVAGEAPGCRIVRGTAEQRADSSWRLLPNRAGTAGCK